MPVRIALVSFLVLGCAATNSQPTSEETSLYSVSEVDGGPEFVGCSRYEPGVVGQSVFINATFTVRPDGRVQDVNLPGDALTRLERTAYTAEDVRGIVTSCEYRPAVKEGRAVGVRSVTKSFRLSATS
jgi:hypothetical protein